MVNEKLRLMETLWSDLCQDDKQVPAPDWHGEVLEERDRKIAEGEESFVDWAAAKDQLRRESR